MPCVLFSLFTGTCVFYTLCVKVVSREVWIWVPGKNGVVLRMYVPLSTSGSPCAHRPQPCSQDLARQARKIRCFVRPPVSWGGGAAGDPTCHKLLLGWKGHGCTCEAGFLVARTSLMEARVERGRPGLGQERRRAWLLLAPRASAGLS